MTRETTGILAGHFADGRGHVTNLTCCPDPIDQPTPGSRSDSSTGAIVSKPEPAPYGHNRYRVWHHGRYIGTVDGGGDRNAAGRSDWWTADARPAAGQPYGRSFRYQRNRREAIDALIVESYRQERKAK